jgi:tetratricopeptide (TPR) repeat protein
LQAHTGLKTVANIVKQVGLGKDGRQQQGGSSLLQPLPVCFFFALVVFLLYGNTFQHPYIFDDWAHIEANRHIRLTSLSWEGLRQAAFASPLDRPVAYVSLALNYYFHGYDLFGYHLVNILIHLCSACFLFLFLRTTLALPQIRAKDPGSGRLAFCAALLWLVHPVQIQSVTYLIQRMNSLAAMFYILAMLFYARGRLAAGAGRRILLFAGCTCAGVLALGSKEIAATLPFFILLYEWFFFQDLHLAWLRKKILPVLVVGLLLGGAVVLFLGLHPFSAIAGSYGIRDFTPLQRVLTEFRVVLFYISLLLLPSPGRLNIDHDFSLSLSLFEPVTTVLALAMLLGLFLLAAVLARRERLLSFAILWFLGNLVIESSVIGLEIIFEHRTYLPGMLAIFALVLLGGRLLPRRWPQAAAALLVVVLFATWTYQRNLVWQDEVTLRRDAVAKSPTKARALAVLANALERSGQYGEAELYYRKTLALPSRFAPFAHHNLGNVLLKLGKVDEAVEQFQTALSLEPGEKLMRLNLAYALVLQGKTAEAAAEYQELIRRYPRDPRPYNNLGRLLLEEGKIAEAIPLFREALRLKPDYGQARLNLEEAVLELLKTETP